MVFTGRCSAANVGPKPPYFSCTFRRIFLRCFGAHARLEVRPAIGVFETPRSARLVTLPQPLGLTVADPPSKPAASTSPQLASLHPRPRFRRVCNSRPCSMLSSPLRPPKGGHRQGTLLSRLKGTLSKWRNIRGNEKRLDFRGAFRHGEQLPTFQIFVGAWEASSPHPDPESHLY